MKEIKLLMEKIEDELEDAHAYATMALEYKTSDANTAELFYKLSEEEMDHMHRLHKAAERLIEGYRRQRGAPPEGMKAVYEHLHQRGICKAERIGVLQKMYAR